MTAGIPDIRPISDLRTKLGEIEASARESGGPVVLVRNGTPSLVVFDSVVPFTLGAPDASYTFTVKLLLDTGVAVAESDMVLTLNVKVTL